MASKVDLRIAALHGADFLIEGCFHGGDYGEEKIVRQNELSTREGVQPKFERSRTP